MLTVTYTLNAALMIVLPIILGIVLVRRFKTRWSLLLWGALVFIVSQGIRLPLLYGLTALLAGKDVMSKEAAVIFNIVFLSVTAGIFEESGRWLGYRFLVRDARTWEDGVTYGAGHGGGEAIILGGLAGLAVINMVLLQSMDLSTLPLTADQQAQTAASVAAFWSAPWYMSLLGAVERVFALCLHISLSVMVLQCFVRKNWLWWLAAIAWHGLANIIGVGLAQWLGPVEGEAGLAVVAVISLAILFALRRRQAPAQPVEVVAL